MSAADVLSGLGGVLILVGSCFFLLTAVGMLRARDAISRVNNLSPATGVGLPLILLGAATHELGEGELSVVDGIEVVLAIGAALIVSSIASNLLGRAAYRTQSEIDPRTLGNALDPFDEPAQDEPGPAAFS